MFIQLCYSLGERNAICIGVCGSNYPSNLMPGCSEYSIGLRTLDGCVLHFPRDAEPLGFSCRRGSTLRCRLALDPLDHANAVVEFFKDGERVTATPVRVPEGGLYGVVSMMSEGERIQLSPPVLTSWSQFDQVWKVCTPEVVKHHRGGVCSYVGPGYSEESIGAVRTKQRLDPLGPLSSRSFEIRILDPGESTYIAIGICCQTYPPNMLPGWKETSVGYHADNGCLFHNSDDGKPTGVVCRKGDIVRCTVQPMDGGQKQVSVLFHCNCQFVGKVTAWTPDDGFYGSFGMMSKNECVQVSLPEISEPYTIPKASFLSVWETVTPNNIQYQDNGVFIYSGEDGGDSVGSIRSKSPLNPLSPNNTFEVKIVDPGERCYIALGVCSHEYSGTQLPGWAENSVGFHADNGLILDAGEEQFDTRCNCVKGDVLRCSVEPVDGSNKQVYVIFHRNSILIGKVLLWNAKEGFYAQVGTMSKGEIVQIASPQTVPSSLSHDSHPRSMSVPAARHTRETTTFPPVVQREAATEQVIKGHIPRVQTAPVMQVPSLHGREATYSMVNPQPHRLHPDDQQHQLHHSVSPPAPLHPQRTTPPPHHVPSEHAVTASPFPLQLEGGHPLGQPDTASYRVPHDRKHNPFYASQVSTASAASDSGARHWSQISTGSQKDIRLQDVTERPASATPPLERYHARTQHLTEPNVHTRTPHIPTGVFPSAQYWPHTQPLTEPLIHTGASPGVQYQAHTRPLTEPHIHTGASPGVQYQAHTQPLTEPHIHTGASPGVQYQAHTQPLTEPHIHTGASPGVQYQAHTQPLTEPHIHTGASPGVQYQAHTQPLTRPESQKDIRLQDVTERPASATPPPEKYHARTQPLTDSNVHTGTPHVHTAAPQGTQYLAHTQPISYLHTGASPQYTQPVAQMVLAQEERFLGGVSTTHPLEQQAHDPDSNSTVRLTSEYVYEPVEQAKVGATGMTPSAYLLSKKENSMCRMLHNASYNEGGTLRCTLPADSTDSSFMIRRLQLTEKMPYFEVELVEYKDSQNVIVGLVPQNCPHTAITGPLPIAIAYNTATGALSTSGQENKSISKPCTKGYVIGCEVDWTYKLEASDPSREPLVKVEWFCNGCSMAVESISAPSSGLYPAVEMTGGGTAVSIRHRVGLKPDMYFNSHPLPDNCTNIQVPECITEGWRCIQNGQVDENNYVMFADESSHLPTVIQAHTPFNTVKAYFEAELQYPISSYSILSVGALAKISDSKHFIPGEAPNSIALFPLLGLVMCNGSISTTLPQTIDIKMKNSSEKLRVGIGVDFHHKVPLYTSTNRRVKIFFTVDCQLVNITFVTIPSTGLYPTIAVGSDFRKAGDQLLCLQFSHPRPQVSDLPLGFARAPPNAFKRRRSRTTVAETCLPEGLETPQCLQAAMPLSPSHSYFEMRITRCHESHVFSCGLTPHSTSLTSHPGHTQDSIGFHPSQGAVHHNGLSSVVCPPCTYKGVKIGCGARFSPDGSSKYMEVFFTVNGSIVYFRLMTLPQPGLFPTLGFCTKGNGIASVDLYKEDPFPDLQFSTVWRELRNMKAEGAVLQATSTDTCVAQLAQSILPHKPTYFTISATTVSDARILVGFSNCVTCPLLDDHHRVLSKSTSDSSKAKELARKLPLQKGWAGCMVDLGMREALIEDNLISIEHCSLEQSQEYGCGVEPIKDTSFHLFFLTRNTQVVFCRKFHLAEDAIFPTVFVSGHSARIHVDACALWPLVTSLGRGWGRVHHLVLQNSKIRHIATDQHANIPVGFAQAAMPIIPSSSYFEVEVCSRAVDKAIAVGLASRAYPSNTWVGWKHNSLAYHLDDGNLFTGSGMFSHKIGPKIFQGHVIGCGVNAKLSDSETKEGEKVEVFFTVNGAVIVEQRISVPSGGFYPTICLESPTESVVFHRYSCFPPVQSLMGSEWGNCYSVQQAGAVLEHSCKHKELPPKGIPRGFCQASRPISPDRSYFEIEVVGFTAGSVIQAGVALKIPLGTRNASTNSVMYSCIGQIQTRYGGHKTTTAVERCGMGDLIGCRVVYTEKQPSIIVFYLNSIKLRELPLADKWRGAPLFPTIVLSHRGNAVLPKLNLSLPSLDQAPLIGWLRTERVRVRGNIAEYHPSNSEKEDVGLCQVSQCLDKNMNSSFEVEIMDRGKGCRIAVGAASANYPAVNQPGWKEDSVAYHGDDGFLFNNDPYGVSFGPKCKERDVVGVGVRPLKYQTLEEDEAQVYFTMNGLEMGHTTVSIPPRGLFPSIGFHSPGEKVKITLNSSTNGLGNFNPGLLYWRDMCGMKLQSTSQDNQYILHYHDNGRKVPLTGVKLAQAIHGEPFSEKLQYFEVELLSVSLYSAIAIGVVPKRYCLHLAPGWGKDSLGYHSDNGQLYQARDRGKHFGPIAKRGDIVGCGINFIPNSQSQCSIFFTHNGAEIGRVRAKIPTAGFYPSVCLTHKYNRVRVTMLETFKPKVLTPEMQNMVGLMRISNCSYSDQIVQFSGGSAQGSAPGIAQFTVPMHKDRNYFAAHVLRLEDGVIIGLAVKDYPLKYPPGSTSVSVAYDIAKGSIRAVYDNNNFHKFDDPELKCTVGDRIGCGLVTSDSKSKPGFVYFTKNGAVVKRIQLIELFEDLYPVIGFVPEKRLSLLFMDWNMPLFASSNLLFEC